MELTNYKTFEKWCDKSGFRPAETLEEVECWASECDHSYGCRDIEFETGRTTKYGSPETIGFELVKPEICSVENGSGEIVGEWIVGDEWTFDDNCDINGTIEEPRYRFMK